MQVDFVEESMARVELASRFGRDSAMPCPAQDEGFTLSEIFPTRIRRRRTLIEQVDVGLAKRAIAANVSLIRTIPPSMFPRIEGMVLRVFRGQSDRDGLIRWLNRAGGVSEARARMIADDQIAKASEAFLRLKWASQGVEFVRWVHGSAFEPRSYHAAGWDGASGISDGCPNGLDGFVFRMDSPPVIDQESGERGFPAQLIGCTCHLEPIRINSRSGSAVAGPGRR